MATVYRCDKCASESPLSMNKVELEDSNDPRQCYRGDLCDACWRRLITWCREKEAKHA